MEVGVSDIRKLNQAFLETYFYDFSDYAQSSFRRRISRILQVNGFKSIDELIRKIKSDRDYYSTFLEEITVNTTEMFRDPSFWVAMRTEVLPRYQEYEKIRIWHAGCSSGEEIYSMCILLHEMNLLDRANIYATDISQKILEDAKSGTFPIRNLEINQQNYERFGGTAKFKDYYKANQRTAQLEPRLLRNITFKVHNLISETEPFMKFDIILCRNVMIYFNSTLQEKVFSLFHSSLQPRGVLGIGSKESIMWNGKKTVFKTFNNEEKIYIKE